MLEELNLQEMSEILGGASKFCDKMQEIANTAEDWTAEDWDNWGEAYEKHCMS